MPVTTTTEVSSKLSRPLIHGEQIRFTLFNETDVPSGGWRYTDPDLGICLSHINLPELFRSATQLRIANRKGLPRMWPLVFRSIVCEQMNLGPTFCREFVNPRSTKETDKKRALTFGDVRNFLAVLKEWMLLRSDFVAPEEAERRASICAACPENVPATGCAGCTNIVSLITSVIGDRNTSSDEALKNCNVCGCANKAQVHVPLDVLAKGITPDMAFPEGCWKREAAPKNFL